MERLLRSASGHRRPHNHILASLSNVEYRRLASHFEAVRLDQGDIVFEFDDRITYVYFLDGGMASLLATSREGNVVEIGMVGNEGMIGTPVISKIKRMPFRVMMQISGEARRLRTEVLLDEFGKGGRLQDLVARFSHTVLAQIAQSAVCNRFHTTQQRLSRWLLVSRDRTHSDEFPYTQEFLSHMLGSPRTAVTAIAAALQRERLIRYSRGKVAILDPQGLHRVSCECYEVVQQDYRRFLAA